MTILTINSDARRRVSHFRDLIVVLVQKEIKVRYKNSALGYGWSVANPLLFAAVYFVALGVFLRIKIPGYPYPLFLIAGQFPWQWLATSVGGAPMIFIGCERPVGCHHDIGLPLGAELSQDIGR